NLKPKPDIVVVGNAISRGNPELEHVLNQAIYYTSLPAVVQDEFLRTRHSVVIAGTHGKTTTTSLMAWALDCAGAKPSFLIGGVAENFHSSFRLTEGKHFVIEGDEYDTAYFDKGPKFMHYLPKTVILNNVEFDHADIYRDIDAIKFAFSRLINLIPGNGCLLAGWDSILVRELAPKALCRVEIFGACADAGWRAENIDFTGELTTFDVLCGGENLGRYRTPLAGMFNVRNCLGVIAACESLGLDRKKVADSLAEFKSVKRRMEVRGVVRAITVIDDFAHHPTAVRETLSAARQKYPNGRIVAVFEPRSYTAQLRIFQKDFEESLALADIIVVAGLFHPERYTSETGASPQEMAEHLRAFGKDAVYLPGPDEIVEKLVKRVEPGDVIVVMSNGSFGGIHLKLLSSLAIA
ncbi:MAG TPA: UDP-N-acetylmuramate:L-alanyl-gamma-D-glutamyl-meso-diaminopimelate ligase, partial [Blastocatellia bacterium]|nr:UDP-N-acetylmuramate:L-alanyl-gamma-D-glutamyl-meso-diaminopimelate ligase [Blastocatellia bacterium]